MRHCVTVAVALLSIVVLAVPRPDLVERVKKGELAQAHVSWWGFDATDSTRFIRSAISSGVKKVVFDRMEGPWHSQPLKVVDVNGLELSFERGAELVACRGAFTNRVEALLTFWRAKNVKISGYGAHIRMWRCDYARPPYCWSEWRHAVSFMRGENIIVEGLRIEESGGDGLYLNGVKDCTIRDVICDRNYRQGISVIGAENLLIENCTLSNTRGTPPAAGIDFEPNRVNERLVNCVMRNCTISDNEGAGVDIALVCLNGKSEDVSFLFENCRVMGNRYGLRLGTENPPLNAVKGVLEMRNCLFDRSEHGLSLNENEDMPIKIRTKGCVLRTASADGTLVETPLDAAWLSKIFPPVAAASLPDVKHVRDRGLDRSVVHDEKPGQMVRCSPLRIRRTGLFVFFADKPGPVHFTARQWRLGSRGRLTDRTMRVADASGKIVAGLDMTKVGERESPVEISVPAKGFYFLEAASSGSLFSLLSTDVPVAIDVTDSHINLNSSEGALYVPVPAGGNRLAIFVGGSYPGEFVAASVKDPSGKEIWRNEAIMQWRTCFLPEKPMPGVWTLELKRSQGHAFDDFKCELAGVPAFLFLSPEKYWSCPPSPNSRP